MHARLAWRRGAVKGIRKSQLSMRQALKAASRRKSTACAIGQGHPLSMQLSPSYTHDSQELKAILEGVDWESH